MAWNAAWDTVSRTVLTRRGYERVADTELADLPGLASTGPASRGHATAQVRKSSPLLYRRELTRMLCIKGTRVHSSRALSSLAHLATTSA